MLSPNRFDDEINVNDIFAFLANWNVYLSKSIKHREFKNSSQRSILTGLSQYSFNEDKLLVIG